MARTTSDEWVDAGFATLREGGSNELTVERLCERMQRTKGAFYHRYKDISAYQAMLLAAWKEQHTMEPMAAAERAAQVTQRRAALYRAVGKLDMKLELAVRAWAETDPRARAARAEVDEMRANYLASLWGSGAKARMNGEIEYALFLGLLSQHGEGAMKHAGLMIALRKALGE